LVFGIENGVSVLVQMPAGNLLYMRIRTAAKAILN
jgi:hypothetical protein